MLPVDLEAFSFLYLTVGIGIILGLWLAYDWADHREHNRLRIRTLYQCIRCGTLYQRTGHRRPSDCPNCQFRNDRLHF